ncbi:MAG: DUF72 domain-containing protein [Deltaproteobacteria bacterium]|nr:DUF72 domain-containing protein [Deltaproteobacteria bacterium]
MRILAGTSGFGYGEWKGSFYPPRLRNREMLGFYAERLPAVELNSTFYRLPTQEVLHGWSEQVPAAFRFTAKAPRRLTHLQRLAGPPEDVVFALRALSGLGERLACVLFQLPPRFPKDLRRLSRFLQLLPAGTRAAFEFRDPSWLGDDVAELLAAGGFPLCALETDELPARLHPTPPWGYVKLRRSSYREGELEAWLDRIRGQPWEEVYVFFKHEEEAKGPKLAARFLELAARP